MVGIKEEIGGMQGQWAAELSVVSSAAEQERASADAQHAALEQQLRAAQVEKQP